MSLLELAEIQHAEDLQILAHHFTKVLGCPCGDVVTLRESLLCGGFCAVSRMNGRVVGGTWGMLGQDSLGLFDQAVIHAISADCQGTGIGRLGKPYVGRFTSNDLRTARSVSLDWTE